MTYWWHNTWWDIGSTEHCFVLPRRNFNNIKLTIQRIDQHIDDAFDDVFKTYHTNYISSQGSDKEMS